MICGVDEAGRGPVIGPLVVAGVMTDEAGVKRLIKLGVKDSKKHSPTQREELYNIIISFTKHHSIHISPEELDSLMISKSLNKIEAKVFAGVIDILSPALAYVDSADVSTEKFREMILLGLNSSIEIVAEHKADERYPVVSAASIIAKVERDRVIKELHKTHGNFGSGYPSDPKTIKFLKNCVSGGEGFPDCVRKRWKTAIRASNLKLEEFF